MNKKILSIMMILAAGSHQTFAAIEQGMQRQFLKQGNQRLETVKTEAKLEDDFLQKVKNYFGENHDISYQNVAQAYNHIKEFYDTLKQVSDESKQLFFHNFFNHKKPEPNTYNYPEEGSVYDENAIKAQQEKKLKEFKEIYDDFSSLILKEKEGLSPFKSEDPRFLEKYQRVAKNLSLFDIADLWDIRLPLRAKEFWYNWVPLPAKVQALIPSNKRDRVNEFVDSAMDEVLDDEFLKRLNQKRRPRNSQITNIQKEDLRDFARQYYSLDSKDRGSLSSLYTGRHAPLNYWYQDKKERIIDTLKDFNDAFTPLQAAKNQWRESRESFSKGAQMFCKAGTCFINAVDGVKGGIGKTLAVPYKVLKNITDSFKVFF